jgi:F-type H+-transporting ATPase subunit delta
MSTLRASNRYAKALLDLARERQALDVIKSNCDSLLSVLKESRDFRVFLKSPVIKPEQKLKTFENVFAAQLDPLMNLFLALLVKHGREAHLEDVLEKYTSLYLAEKKVVRARVASASALSPEQVNQLLALLKTPEASDVQLEQVVDEDLIGGFVLRVADKQIDASVSSALSKLEREFDKNLYIADF